MSGKQEDDQQLGSASFSAGLAPAANLHSAMYLDNHGISREPQGSPHLYSSNTISGDIRYAQQQRQSQHHSVPPPQPPLPASNVDSPFIQYQDYNSTSVTPLTASPADSVYSQHQQHQYAYPPRPVMQDIPAGNMGLSLDMQAYPPAANTSYSDYNSPPAPQPSSSTSLPGHSRAGSYGLGMSRQDMPFSHNEHLQREIQQKQQQLQQLKQALQQNSYRLMSNNATAYGGSGGGVNTSDDNQANPQNNLQELYSSNMGANSNGQSQFPSGSSSSQLSYRPINAYQPSLLGKAKVTTTLWEDEGTICFQVEARGVCVARREDNNMINGTKLLNVAGMTRGRRDGILKAEKERYVVKVGAMHLKGVWITFDRALHVARKEDIVDLLYPLFVYDIRSLLYPPNYLSTAATRAALDSQRLRVTSNQQVPSVKGGHSPAPSVAQPSYQQQQRWSQQQQLQQQQQQHQYQDFQAVPVNNTRVIPSQDCSPVSGLGVNSAGSDSLSWSPRLTPPVSLNNHRASPALNNFRPSASTPSTPGDIVMPTIYPQQQQQSHPQHQQQQQSHIHSQPQRPYRQHQYHPSMPQGSFNLQLPPSRRSSGSSHRYSNSIDLAYTGRYDRFPDLGPPVDLKRSYDKRGETDDAPAINSQRQMLLLENQSNAESTDTSWSNRTSSLMSPVSVSQSRFINRPQTSLENSPSSARSPASMNMGQQLQKPVSVQSRHTLLPHQQQPSQHLRQQTQQQQKSQETAEDEEYKNDHGYNNVGDHHGDCVSHQNTTPLGLSFGSGLDKPTPYGGVSAGGPATLTPTSLNAIDCSKSASRDSDKYSDAAATQNLLLLDSVPPNTEHGGLGLVLSSHRDDGVGHNGSPANAYFGLHQDSHNHHHHPFDPSQSGFDLKPEDADDDDHDQNGFYIPQPEKQIDISSSLTDTSNNNNNKVAPPAGRPLKRFCSDESWGGETASKTGSGSELNASSSTVEGNAHNVGDSSGFGI